MIEAFPVIIHPFHQSQGLFGEHHLNTDHKKNVAIVESEKTAIISTGFIPDNTYGLQQQGRGALQNEKLKSPNHSQFKLYPDLGVCEK
ncbi:MAG: DUF6371 domain-containing protein [Chlorobium sp.]